MWPLSDDIRSKQFLKVFKNEDGNCESMIQRVYRLLRKADPTANVVVATSKEQEPFIYSQLGDNINISVEPCRKDTFPAIVLASAYLYDICGISKEDPVVVCPVDPYVESDYFEAVKELDKQVQKREANIVLMGVEATYPSEKYGYIIPQNGEKISKVLSFEEKPNPIMAQKHIERNALWNSGVFAYKLSYVLNKAKSLINFVDYQELYNRYDTLCNISFDYAVVEKECRMQVVRFTGQWKDMGTWEELTEIINDKIVGNAIMNEECKNVHIVNELKIPILAMGLHDVVISASERGILISDKNQSIHIKPFVDEINTQYR